MERVRTATCVMHVRTSKSLTACGSMMRYWFEFRYQLADSSWLPWSALNAASKREAGKLKDSWERSNKNLELFINPNLSPEVVRQLVKSLESSISKGPKEVRSELRTLLQTACAQDLSENGVPIVASHLLLPNRLRCCASPLCHCTHRRREQGFFGHRFFVV